MTVQACRCIGMFDNIVIGVDRRQGGRDAIALGRTLQGRGGRLTLAHVYQGKGDTALLRRAPTADDESVRERGLDHLTAVGQRLGLAAALACVKAPTPARGLHRLARSSSADLLVVGSSRRGMIGRLMLGDDTRATLDRPPCAVAVAPAGFARR
ncbi:MAG: universal stress protein, partial [Solirubrobacteraceae bacterium]